MRLREEGSMRLVALFEVDVPKDVGERILAEQEGNGLSQVLVDQDTGDEFDVEAKWEPA